MFWFQNELITFALVLTATNLSYGRRWYGPGGIQPARPLGPGGVQPIQPLGPGGIRKSSDGECCFAYGFGSRMKPCCFEIITCERHYQLLRMENGRGRLGGAHGKHH